MREYYTYIYYDPTRNNEPFYVGKGCGSRAWAHLTRKGKHPLIQRIAYIRKQDKEPIIGLYAGLDEEFALFLEEELITKIGRRDLDTGPLTNLQAGGDSWSRSDLIKAGKQASTKKKKPMTDEHRANIAAGHKGIKHSLERVEKTRIANLGKKRSEETKQKMRKPKSEEHKANMRKPKSEAGRAAIAASNRNRYINKEIV